MNDETTFMNELFANNWKNGVARNPVHPYKNLALGLTIV